MADVQRIVVLTGAGISAESGVATFRGPDGLWEGHRVEDVATPEAFRRDPVLVHRFYDTRRAALAGVQPNAAHRALARLDRQWPGELLLVTQNVDNLHERAGSQRLIHMHGALQSAWCRQCDGRFPWQGALGDGPACPGCDHRGALRPDIVWFGEMPYRMDEIWDALAECDLFAAIGTSGQVYPAAGFGQVAARNGADTVELNLDASAVSRDFARHILGPASRTVPGWVDGLLA